MQPCVTELTSFYLFSPVTFTGNVFIPYEVLCSCTSQDFDTGEWLNLGYINTFGFGQIVVWVTH